MAEQKYTYEEVIQALRNADAAGDAESAARLAQIADSMAVKPSVAKQVSSGVGKRAQEIGQALRGVGLRVGETVGLASPEDLAAYEQEVEQSRSIMSPQYRQFEPRTVPEYLGGLGLDVATMMGGGGALRMAAPAATAIPRVGQPIETALQYGGQALTAPRTIPQAALGGGLYSQTIPFPSGEEAIMGAAISSALGGAIQPAARALGLAPSPETKLSPAQVSAAKRGVEAGFQFTPSQMTGSRTGMFIEEGIRALPLARGAYSKLEDANQETLQKIAARSIGLKEGVPFTANAMQESYQNALSKYKTLQQVPALKLDKGFGQEIDKIKEALKKVPEEQRAQLEIPKVEAVLDNYKEFMIRPVDGATMYNGSIALGDQLNSATSSLAVGALKDLRTAFENAIERRITNPALKNIVDPNTIKTFRDGRTQLSNWYTVNEGFNAATGELSGPKIAGSLARKSNFGTKNTELESAALAVKAVPRALPSSGTTERAEAANLVKQMAAAGLGGGVAGMYTQDPYAALVGAGATQLLPAIAARLATSEPVRSIVARRQLGAVAPDEGTLARAFREFETGVPSLARYGLGDVARIAAQQQAVRGLLGE